MDSVIGEDVSLPINFEESGRFGGLQNDTSLYPDITTDNFSQHFPNPAATGGPAMNSSSGKLSPSRAYTMKDLEQQISELKKENFSLKLRIYYMEEKIQQKYEDDDDIKTNIELKVEAESLKKELMDKQQLLGKASQAVESLALEKEQLLKKREKEQDVNLKHLQEKYEEKLRDKEEENKYLKELQDDLQSQLEKAQELQQELEREVRTKAEEKELASESSRESIGEKDRVIDQLQSALQTKEEVISRLMEEKQQTSEGTLQPLRKDNDKLRKELAEKEKEVEDLKRELEDELTEEKRNAEERIEKQKDGNLKKIKQLEETLEKAKEELAGKDDDMKDLENDLRSAQNAEKEAAKELNMAKNEIQSLKSNTLKRDKAIQGFVQAMRGKEKEIDQLYQQLDNKDKEVSVAREAMHKAEMKKYQDLEQYQSSVSDIQTNVADLKADLHAKQLENEGLQKTNACKQQEIDRLRNEKIQGEADNQKRLGEKEADIQDLQNQVQEARDRAARETGDMKDHYEDLLDDCKKDLDKKDKLIQKLNKTLQDKDEIIQEQSRDADSALDDLKKRLKEKEKRLEGKVEEQILATEAAEAEADDLRKLLKEKENDLEQLHRANLDQKQKFKDLENRLKGAGDQNKQLTEALNLQSRSKEVQDEGLKRSLGEKEAIIGNLQKSIAEKDGMLENLRDLLEGQARGETAKEDLFKQLTAKLRDKEKQLQEMVAERADVANANQKATQDLLDALRDKDEQIKDLNGNLGKQMSQHSNKIRNLQRELDNKDLELQGAGDALNRAEREQENLVGKLRNALEEKDKTIEKLLDSGREKDKLFVEMQQAVAKNHPSLVKAAEIQRLKDEADGLRESLSGKEDEVRRLKSSLPEKGELDSLRAELQNKNKLLERAKATIDQLQQPEVSKYEIARQKRRLTELEAKLEAKERELDAKMEDEKAKDRLIKELQIRVNLADNRKGRGSGNDDLHDALREQIKELSRLTDTLKAERQLYVNITQSGTKDESDSSRTRLLDSELAAVQALRHQLENGLHSRDDIRISIDGRPYFSSNTSGVGSDVHESSYGPSSREQNSRDLQTREAQAGRVEDTSSLVSEPLVKRQYVNVMDMSIPEMREELLDLRNQLDRSARQEEVSEERVRREDLESLRSIPGQEDDTTDKNNDALKQRVDSLEAQLQRREQEAVSLNQQLEAALFNQSRDGAGSNSHVIPILKQQLDQAKTLLREKDSALQEREQECQRMKQRSKSDRDSPQVGAALQQENERLGQFQKDLIAKVQQKLEQIRDLEEQNGRLKEINERLTRKMDETSREMPHLKSQLEKAKSVIRKRERENVALREKLGIGPKDDIDSGKTKVDHLEVANAILKEQLQDKTDEADVVRSELDSAHAEMNEMTRQSQEKPNPELHNLRKKLKTAENMNRLLKKHIALNTPRDGEAGEFNPQLIIDLAREIERLQGELKKAGVEVRQSSGTDCKETQTREDPVSKDVLSALQDQLAHCQRELKESVQKVMLLQRKVRATEGTVHLQANRIQRYRRQLHNSGLSPASTPKRVQSDSNLLRSGLTFGQQFPTSESDSEPTLMVDDLCDNSYTEFGQSDDIFELREQVALLKNQNQRCSRAVRMLQSNRSDSRSSSPSRGLSPDRDKSGWFQVVANQEAFTRMQEEVENLKGQLQQANDVNCTLQEQYKDIQTQIEEAQVIPENPEKDALKAKEKEIVLLRGYLEESKRLCDLMKEMLLEALKTMGEIKQARDWLDGNLGEDVLQRFELAQEKLKRGADMADTLHKALDEPSSSSGRSTPKKKTTFAESLKIKLREISDLQKQLERSKKANHSLRQLLEENQHVADETRKELEKLTSDALEKQQRMGKLQHQLREAMKAKSALERQRDARMTRDSRNSSTQTDHFDTTPLHDVPDLAQLHSKLRENQLLVCTLKSELEVYRNVLHSKTPEGSPHSVKTGRSGTRDSTDSTLRDYLEELRALRKKLEDSIKVNDKLRKQLEGRLDDTGGGSGGVTTIHLQETNIELTTRVETLNAKLVEKDNLNQKLREDYKQAQRDISRLESENHKLSEQLLEVEQLQNTLRFELSVYEQIHPTDSPANETTGERGDPTLPKITDPKTGIDLTELLKEMRRLRIQLERSIDTNNALRTKLEEMMKDKRWSPSNAEYKHSRVTVKQTVTETNDKSTRNSRLSRRLFVNTDDNDGAAKDDFHTDFSPYEDPQFYDMPPSNKSPHKHHGATHSPPSKDAEYFAVGSLLTYERLKKTLGELRAVLRVFDTLLGEEKDSQAQEKTKLNTVHQLRSLITKASVLAEESNVQLSKFTTERLPRTEEVNRLKRQVVAQQKLMKDTISHLTVSNRSKESIEEAILNNLMEHEANLVRAHRNLEAKRMNGTSHRHQSH
ncbi:uncharacterized protein [Apostichopus japonicus]|uniref:uncharacterized protein isoform X2 n=1 Tax=Stichopus japonicus TaxID=307972 RepID=UPI003AB68172